MATAAQIKEAQAALARAGFYNTSGQPLSGRALEAQVKREADGDPRGRTRQAIERAKAAGTSDPALAAAIALLDGITPQATAVQASVPTTGAVYTIPEGATLWEIDRLLAKKYGMTPTQVDQAIRAVPQNKLDQPHRTTVNTPCGTITTDGVVTLIKGGKLYLPEPFKAEDLKDLKLVKGQIGCPPMTPDVPDNVLPAAFKLPVYSRAVTATHAGNDNIYSAANTSLLLGRWPEQPETAPMGRSDHKPPKQTSGDHLRAVSDIAAQAVAIPIGPVIFIPLQLRAGDRADYMQAAKGGSNGQWGNDVTAASDASVVTARYQYPLSATQLDDLGRPLSPGAIWKRDATRLPFVGMQHRANGAMVGRPGTEFTNNQFYTTPQGPNAVTISDKLATTGVKNDRAWASGSKPIHLTGLSNYGMAEIVNPQLEGKIQAAMQAFRQSPNRATAQHAMELLNYQSTLTGISNGVENVTKVSVPRGLTPEQLLGLPPIQKIAAMRQSLLDAVQSNKITGVNQYALPAVTPITSETKAYQRAEGIKYFDTLAQTDPKFSEWLYNHKEFGNVTVESMSDPAKRREAVTKFVDALLIDYPENGTPLTAQEAQYSTRDPKNLLDVRFNNFNAFERGQEDPKVRATNPAIMTQGMKLISEDAGLTALFMRGAGNDTRIAEAFAYRDRLSYDMPAEMGKTHGLRYSRDAAMKALRERGYSEETLATTLSEGPGQSILRGDQDAVQRSLAASIADGSIVARRRDDLEQLATDGNTVYPGFRVGDLQQRFLMALATDGNTDGRGSETWNNMKAYIRSHAANPAEAETKIETLKQAIHFAKNEYSRTAFGGRSHDDMATTTRAGLFSGNVIAGAVVPGAVSTSVSSVNYGSIAKNARQSQDLVGRLATSSGTAAGEVFGKIADPANENISVAQRKQLAQAALGSVNGNPNARALLTSTLDGADKDRFQGLNPRNLSTDDAIFVLAKVNADRVRQDALAGIARDPGAARTIVQTMADYPQVGAQVTAAIGAPAVAATRTTPPGARTAARQPRVTPDIEDFAEAARGKTTLPERQAALAAQFFRNPATAQHAMDTLAARQTDTATALAVATLAQNPALIQPTIKTLKDAGDVRGSSWLTNPQDDLARIVERLAAAQASNDTAALTKQSELLKAFVANPQNAQAMSDLISAVRSTPAGVAAYATIVSAAIAGDSATATGTFNAIQQANPSGADHQAAATQQVLANSATIPGWLFPWAATPNPKIFFEKHSSPPQHPKQPIPEGSVNVCPPGVVTPTCPANLNLNLNGITVTAPGPILNPLPGARPATAVVK